ncbi:MAG: caspase family protein [Synergistaceae bacterium]|nr:caspase family protein [Synergistaceae bacterium]
MGQRDMYSLKKAVLTFCLVLIAVFALSREGETAARKYALLIGINTYKYKNADISLRGPLNDVALVKDILEKKLGFAAEDITVLLESQATHTGILKAIDELAERAARGDFIYIHYSGHGSTAQDFNLDDARTEGYTGKDSTLVSHAERNGHKNEKVPVRICRNDLGISGGVTVIRGCGARILQRHRRCLADHERGRGAIRSA